MLKPMRSQLLCKQIWQAAMDGNIIIPDEYRKPTAEAKVIDKGPECKRDIDINSRVICDKYKGKIITHDNVEYFLIDEDDIFCVLIPEE